MQRLTPSSSLHISGNTATPSYYHYDGRGDVIAQTNGTGNLTYQAAYDAYGSHGGPSGTQTFGSNTDPFQANSKEEDPSGLLDEGRRYRDLATDTFITRDPLGMVDGPNEYSYVTQNPWTKTDPEGLKVNIDDPDEKKKYEDWKKDELAKKDNALRKEIISKMESSDTEFDFKTLKGFQLSLRWTPKVGQGDR